MESRREVAADLAGQLADTLVDLVGREEDLHEPAGLTMSLPRGCDIVAYAKGFKRFKGFKGFKGFTAMTT
jgi:hypothetical protein